MNIGFSTGSIALGDFNKAIRILLDTKANVIELSALREWELDDLISSLDNLPLNQFNYVSFHAPSKLHKYSEEDLVNKLLGVARRRLPIIVHPDLITDFQLWLSLGSNLCIENMDKRKPIGRTAKDLQFIFEKLPEASFCFDLAHAQQVDPTMTEALLMAKEFRHKLRQLHISYVNSKSAHEPLNLEALLAFMKVVPYLPANIPIILESVVSAKYINTEIDQAKVIFDPQHLIGYIESHGLILDTQTQYITRKEFH